MLSIGKLAARTGTKVPTIRYYEQIGLLHPPERTAANQRVFDRAALGRLSFIRHARQLGFSLGAIRELLDLTDQPSQPCAHADSIARRQLRQVESRIDRLVALRSELKRMIQECDGKSVADCRVIEVLGDHSECLTDHEDIGRDD